MKTKKTAKIVITNKYRLGEILAAHTTDHRKAFISKMIKEGVSYDTVSRIRRTKSDEKYTPNAETIRVIADVLNISMEELFKSKL
jgi:hypothetical protein